MANAPQVRMAGRFRLKRTVTVKQLKMVPNGAPIYIRCEQKMRQGDPVTSRDEKAKQMEPPWLMHVTDMETGEEAQIVVPVVMRSELEKQYPKDSYVGLCFEIATIRIKKEDGSNAKPYNHVTIVEIYPNEDEGEAKGGKKK